MGARVSIKGLEGFERVSHVSSALSFNGFYKFQLFQVIGGFGFTYRTEKKWYLKKFVISILLGFSYGFPK